MAHQQQGDIQPFGQALQGSSALTHLGHRAGRTGQFSVMEGLDAVDDRHGRPQGFQLLQHLLQVRLSQQLRAITRTGATQPAPAQLHLLG